MKCYKKVNRFVKILLTTKTMTKVNYNYKKIKNTQDLRGKPKLGKNHGQRRGEERRNPLI